MAGIDVNRTTTGVRLDPVVSAEIWSAAEYSSAAMQLAQQIPLPGPGVTVDIITGEPEAQWVAETDNKPVSRPTLGSKLMTPYTLAVIVPFSNQFRRDKARLYQELVRKLPQALGKKFDQTVFGNVAAPGSNFDKLSGAASVGIAGNTYKGLVAADQAVATGGGTLNGWAMAPQGRGLLLGAVDGFGRPLFTQGPNEGGSVTQLLGQPVYVSPGVYLADADGAGAGTAAQLGFAGDWSSASWGSVEGVSISIADQATLTDGSTQINLWQRNMFAVRAEIEIGFRVRDIAHFVKLTSATQA
ncbi:phage major capsid protein [Cellulomonas sp. KH9]|uniref:phage major capsid protein n=1 Tax=Cellulomonas sp. KH9 TaxID=1855324 RepID=UPI0008E26288|nr:phage major capsid protein [Cellulomonas sp. KH9]SFK31627.1 phage major capsid protein, HK97 family [Cellulomonas sp. KH9]